MSSLQEGRRPHVVIVGAGFGGLNAARALARAPVDVTVVDRRNYHLFQPLLYQVATAGLSPAQIAQPIRGILRRSRNTRVTMARIDAVDATRRTVRTDEGRDLPDDFLVIATGARHSYFGHDEWESVAPGLKKIDDALEIRRRILSAFELAESCDDAAKRAHLLTFVVVGGGPTGVEMAGAIAELARLTLRHDFRTIDPRDARVVLVEAGPRLLPAFPERLSAAALRSLERLGVDVRLGRPVAHCDADGVLIGNERIAARTILWAAGVAASSAARWLGTGTEKDRLGRVVVQPDLSLADHPEVFVIGDTACARGADGKPLPGLAPVAKQQGRYVAGVIAARVGNQPAPPAFRYRDWGAMATIGRGAAVADFGRFGVSGMLAWLLWGVVHIGFLIGFRNRITVMLDWIWSYLTFQSGVRLITGDR